MRWSSKILATAGIIAGVIVLSVLIGWYGVRKAAPVSEPAPPQIIASAQANSGSNGSNGSSSTSDTERSQPLPQETATAQVTSTSPADPNLITNWDDRLDEVLRDDSEIPEKARKMLEMFPHLPEAGQVEAAQHISNLLANEDYAPFGRYLADPKTPGTVLDVLMTDVLNRPNSAKLPLLFEVASNPNHPKAGEAKDLLQLYLEEDYGTNWNTWQTKVGEWLKNNPD